MEQQGDPVILSDTVLPRDLEQTEKAKIVPYEQDLSADSQNSEDESEWSSSGDEGEKMRKKNLKQLLLQELADDEDDGDRATSAAGEAQPFRSKNEVLPHIDREASALETCEERLKRFGVHLTGTEKLIHVADIATLMKDSIVLDSANPAIILDLGNVVFTEEREILGAVEDVFGNVSDPHYLVLTDLYIQQRIDRGLIKHCQHIFMIDGLSKVLVQRQIQQLMQQKGCDASNQYDEEVLRAHEIEFSDDEKEQLAKGQKKKQKNKQRKLSTEQLEKEVAAVEHVAQPQPQQQRHPVRKQGNAKQNASNNNQQIMIVRNVNGVLQQQFVRPQELQALMHQQGTQVKQVPFIPQVAPANMHRPLLHPPLTQPPPPPPPPPAPHHFAQQSQHLPFQGNQPLYQNTQYRLPPPQHTYGQQIIGPPMHTQQQNFAPGAHIYAQHQLPFQNSVPNARPGPTPQPLPPQQNFNNTESQINNQIQQRR